MKKMSKAEALLAAVRKTKVGHRIIIHNNDQSVWAVLLVECKEHNEDDSECGEVR